MYTLQDLQAFHSEKERIDFCLMAIRNHDSTEGYRQAKIANEYDRQRNTTITQYQKFLYNLKGQAVPDIYTADYKLPSNFFSTFVTQRCQYLLGNGMLLTDDTNKRLDKEKAKLGRDFDTQLQKLGRIAILEGCGYGFWNLDHLEVFKYMEFVPLYDEETGALSAGIRYWQIDAHKPLRFTLYEKDGYTEYIKRSEKDPEILHEKRKYKQIVARTDVSGEEIIDGENYPGFPIIPLWGSPTRQSAIVGIRNKIDCYDLIESGFANDLDDATAIYWIIHNSGGMNDVDLAKFVERMKTIKAVEVDSAEGQGAEAHTIETPHAARDSYLTRLENDLYKDFCILNVNALTERGNVTATEIQAAYVPMDTKADEFEYCVLDFIDALFSIVGIDATPTFKRNRIINQSEETQMIVTAAPYIGDDAVIRHLPFLTPEEAEDIIKQKAEDDTKRLIDTIDNNIQTELDAQNNAQQPEEDPEEVNE